MAESHRSVTTLSEGGFISIIGVDTVAPTTVEMETSPAEVAAWAHANGLSVEDSLCLFHARFSGGALLLLSHGAASRRLEDKGISPGGAAKLVRLLRKTPVIVFVDMRSQEDAAPDFQRLECKTDEALHQFLMRQSASALKRVDVMDAPACHGVGDLEDGCYYDLVFGRKCEFAKMKCGLETLNGLADHLSLIHERDAATALQQALVAEHGNRAVLALPPRDFKTTNGSVPDGAAMVTTDDDVKLLFLLEAKLNADNEYSKAKGQLDSWETVAKTTGPNIVKGAKIVKVLAHTGVSESTKRKAAADDIKLFNRIGNPFEWDGGHWDTAATGTRRPLADAPAPPQPIPAPLHPRSPTPPPRMTIS